MSDVVISFDWVPQIGGAHLWLHQVYRRWPSPVSVLTAMPALMSERARRHVEYDGLPHGSLSIHRRAFPIGAIKATSFSSWSRFVRNAILAAKLAGRGAGMFHCLRAFPEGFVGLLARRFALGRHRLVTYAHGEEILIARTSRLLSWMARRVYAGSDMVIANSESTRRLVLEHCPAARVQVIHPGVDAKAFSVLERDRLVFRDQLPWTPATVVISTVARMERRKNQAAVIAAVAKLLDEGLQVGYVCAGDGEGRIGLEAFARRCGIADRVYFPGVVSEEEKRLIFAASDIHAMPSIRAGEMIEGFGIVFLEAAAAGVPSVSGNNGGQPEAVVHGRTGLVVDGQDSEQLCVALRHLATETDLRREMAVQARAWAAEHDWSSVRDRTLRAVELIR